MAEATLKKGSQTEPETEEELPSAEQQQEEDHGGAGEDSDLSDEDREALRARRRDERIKKRDQRRERQQKDQRRIAALERERADLMARIDAVENRTSNHELARLETAITDTGRAVQHWRQAMAAATTAGDGESHAQAQENWYKARQHMDGLESLKTRTGQGQRQPTRVDPVLRSHADAWMEKNDWYKPNSPDRDSRVMLTVDQSVIDDGFDPRSPEYWDELTARAKQYLPHRYKQNGRAQTQDVDEGEEEDDENETTPLRNGSRRPPQMIGGSSRESVASSSRETHLSSARVRALKEAGKWEDPKKRAAMIKRYEAIDRENGRR